MDKDVACIRHTHGMFSDFLKQPVRHTLRRAGVIVSGQPVQDRHQFALVIFLFLTRISDLAVVPYRQASRRALISGAPTQGTPPRRVTPCG